MKSFGLILALVAAPLLADEKPTPPPAEPLSFSEVVPVEGASAAELYNRGKVWFAKAFVSSNNVLQVQDKEAGTLVGKGSHSYEPNTMMGSACSRGHLGFTVTVQLKDGRYRYEVSDFTHTGTPCTGVPGGINFGTVTTTAAPPDVEGLTKGGREKMWKHLKDKSTETSGSLTKTLKEAMQKPAKDDNW
jgi:hypothetical protein